MNVTFDDDKLPRIWVEETTETLKFDNLILEDSDNEEPEAAEDGQVNDVNNGDTELTSENVGGNSGNTGYEMGSTSHQSSNSGEQMKDQQAEHNKIITMQNHLE